MAATPERSGGLLSTVLMVPVLATGVGYVVASYLASRWLTRSKKRRPERTPADLGLPFEAITCRTADGRARAVDRVVQPMI